MSDHDNEEEQSESLLSGEEKKFQQDQKRKKYQVADVHRQQNQKQAVASHAAVDVR